VQGKEKSDKSQSRRLWERNMRKGKKKLRELRTSKKLGKRVETGKKKTRHGQSRTESSFLDGGIGSPKLNRDGQDTKRWADQKTKQKNSTESPSRKRKRDGNRGAELGAPVEQAEDRHRKN